MPSTGRIDDHAERLARLETNQENIHETLKRVADMVAELKQVSIKQDRDREDIYDLGGKLKALQTDYESLRQEFLNHREWWKARFWMLTAIAGIIITLLQLAFGFLSL